MPIVHTNKVDNFLALGLRKEAESKVNKDANLHFKGISSEETEQLIHELRIHQIELEMQNEELRRTQKELEASREKYFDLYNLAPVGYINLDKEGLVSQANLTVTRILGVSRSILLSQPLANNIHVEDQDIYYHWRKGLVTSGALQSCQLRLKKNDGTTCLALLTATFGQDDEYRVSLIDISQFR